MPFDYNWTIYYTFSNYLTPDYHEYPEARRLKRIKPDPSGSYYVSIRDRMDDLQVASESTALLSEHLSIV
jgi:hypothetical protein